VKLCFIHYSCCILRDKREGNFEEEEEEEEEKKEKEEKG
jgi:hypothetical protein